MTPESSYLEICPHCEEAILTTNQVSQDILIDGAFIRVPNVQVEECRHCGFRSLSGRDTALFDLLFREDHPQVTDLVLVLKQAGYQRMFLKEDDNQTCLGFGRRDYVDQLSEDLRGLYLDNESQHILETLSLAASQTVKVEVSSRFYEVKLPKLGEGENGVVFEYAENPSNVMKVAKPRAYSREHLKEEYNLTCVFEQNGIPVPRIVESDPYGSFMIKEKLAGESLAKIYEDLGHSNSPQHRMVRSAVEEFIVDLLHLFERYPEAKTSVSPNNIFVCLDDDSCRCLLVDTGPAPFHDYAGFCFSEYWDTTIPQKILQYKKVGYL